MTRAKRKDCTFAQCHKQNFCRSHAYGRHQDRPYRKLMGDYEIELKRRGQEGDEERPFECVCERLFNHRNTLAKHLGECKSFKQALSQIRHEAQNVELESDDDTMLDDASQGQEPYKEQDQEPYKEQDQEPYKEQDQESHKEQEQENERSQAMSLLGAEESRVEVPVQPSIPEGDDGQEELKIAVEKKEQEIMGLMARVLQMNQEKLQLKAQLVEKDRENSELKARLVKKECKSFKFKAQLSKGNDFGL